MAKTVTLQIPEGLYAALVERAASEGMTVEAFLEGLAGPRDPRLTDPDSPRLTQEWLDRFGPEFAKRFPEDEPSDESSWSPGHGGDAR
jgi:hypothetical protein